MCQAQAKTARYKDHYHEGPDVTVRDALTLIEEEREDYHFNGDFGPLAQFAVISSSGVFCWRDVDTTSLAHGLLPANDLPDQLDDFGDDEDDETYAPEFGSGIHHSARLPLDSVDERMEVHTLNDPVWSFGHDCLTAMTCQFASGDNMPPFATPDPEMDLASATDLYWDGALLIAIEETGIPLSEVDHRFFMTSPKV